MVPLQLKLACATGLIRLKVANLVINATLLMVNGNLESLLLHPMMIPMPWELFKAVWEGQYEPPTGSGSTASFGALATAKISVDASLAGAIIGKGGVHSKQICRQTGAKLSIRDHEADPNLKNIELEGSFDQIKQATAMVRELIVRIGPSHAMAGGPAPPLNDNFKTKLCVKQ